MQVHFTDSVTRIIYLLNIQWDIKGWPPLQHSCKEKIIKHAADSSLAHHMHYVAFQVIMISLLQTCVLLLDYADQSSR